MQGGKREGSGRNALPEEKKKIGHKIYITNELLNAINEHAPGDSFSEKCNLLLESQVEYLAKDSRQTIRFIDLFAGLGGIRIGFEQAFKDNGLITKCVFSSEIKDYAIKTYKENFNETKVSGDITTINCSEIPDFDYLLAGFPCQPFSFAGKGLGFADTRGTLFFEIERILKDKKPKGFLLENVEGLVTNDEGKTLTTIINKLEKLNYKVNWSVLDSQYFGVAQSRKRIYIVGTKKEKINLNDFPISKNVLGDILEQDIQTIDSDFTRKLFKNFTPDQVIGKAIKDKRGGINNIHSWDINLKGKTSFKQRNLLNMLLKERRKKKWAKEIGIDWMDGMPLTLNQIATFCDYTDLSKLLDNLLSKGYLTLEHPRKLDNGKRIPDTSKPKGYNIVTGKLSFEFTKILDPSKLAPTLVAMDVSRLGVIDNGGLRRLTIREGLRLCGFPENYNLSLVKESEAFDLLGNTVCVPVIKAISNRLAISHKSYK